MTSSYNILPVLVPQVKSSSGFEQLGWHNIGWDLQNWIMSLTIPIIALLVVVAVIITISRWHTRITTVEQKKKETTDRFAAAIQRCKLSEADIACINQLCLFYRGAEPVLITEQHDIFERCVHAAMADARRRPPLEQDETARVIAALRKKLGFVIYPTDKQITSTRAISVTQVCSIFGSASNREPLIKSATVTTVTEQSFRVRFKHDESHQVNLNPGEMVRIAFSRANDAYYGVQVPVLALPAKDSVELGHSIEMKRSQLRKFVRVSANTRLKCRMIKPATPQTPSLPTGEAMEAEMNDLSGGGLSFMNSRALHPGDLVSLGFHIGDAHIAGLKATILRVSERTVKGQQVFLHNCKFNPIEISDQEKIVRFTFERMRILSTWNMKKFN